MGQTVQIQGEEVRIDRDTTAGELKEAVGAADSDVATYRENGRLHALSDKNRVADNVPDNETVSFQPAQGRIFG